MSQLVIYNDQSQALSEVAFVKDTLGQLKIREITDSVQVINHMANWIADTAHVMKIKDPVEPNFKKDIKELILMRFKNLSFDELYYAFKLERYGVYDVKTEHYQSFDATYVSAVLDKYVLWKREMKNRHQVAEQKELPKMSDAEKDFWNNIAVNTCLDHYLEHKEIKDGYIVHVYRILWEHDLLPKDVEYKKKIHKEALEVLEYELQHKKAVDIEEKRQMKRLLDKITSEKPTKGRVPEVTLKCKELVLLKFFRTIAREEKRIAEIRAVFKNEQTL
jgi:hypothetical protein